MSSELRTKQIIYWVGSWRFINFYEKLIVHRINNWYNMHPPENKILNFKISVNLDTHIGKGSTGDVYKGLSLQPLPHPIAVKAIPLQ